jgi:hypothetical protein
MRYLPMILGAGLTERRITCGLQPGRRCHTRAHVESSRRGVIGR